MFLLALMAHANDQEDVLLNAFRQGITETTAVAQDLRNRAKAIAEKKSAMERSVMQMQQSEMEARAKLTRKYNVEFTSSELPKLTATALAAANQIDGATLQKHLLGQSVKLNTGSWTFEAGEFETFRVLTAEEMGHTQRYVVAAQVRGNLSGRTHDLVINMLYHREKAGLVLCAVSAQGK